MKKILLTGSTSSGKTTLLNELKTANMPSVYIIQEVARDLLNKYPGIEKTPDFQNIVFSEQVERENQAYTSGAEIAVCDRGTVDVVAFSRYFNHPVKDEWIIWSKTYNLAFLCDLNDINFAITPLQKLLAQRDWNQYRTDVDLCIQKVLRQYNINYTVLCGTVKARVEKIKIEIDILLCNR